MQFGPLGPQHGQKLRKMGKGVVRAGGCFRMVLHGEERQLTMAHALDGAIVEVQMGDLEPPGSGHRIGISNYREAMILRGDENLTSAEIAHRMIASAVPIRELRGRSPEGQPDQLMAETDAEGGQAPAREITNVLDGVSHRCWIAWAIRKEKSVGT